MHLLGNVLAVGGWTALCVVIRHEFVEQHRSDGIGWIGPGQ